MNKSQTSADRYRSLRVIVKSIMLLLAAGIAATAAAEVWYVPGWNRTTETNGLAYTSCTNVFEGSVCVFRGWDGDRGWSESMSKADRAARQFADEIAATNDAFRAELVIVGHSLGGRIVARTLAELARKGVKIDQGILLAPAMPMDDSDVALMGGGCFRPAVLVVNPHDSVLKYGYDLAGGEGAPSLGRNGAPAAVTNVVEYAVPKTITEETSIDALWGRSETVKRVCNHLAAFYFTELRRILDGRPAPNAQVRVPQGRINLEWKVIDAGLWWDVLETCGGWKLERNIVSKHCRIVSPAHRRAAWGSETAMRTAFAKIRAQLDQSGGKQ